MSAAENFKNMANDAAQGAAKAAKFAAYVSKRRILILKEQESIRRNYAKLGKVYYKDYITDEEPDEAEYTPLCDSISESFRLINQMKEEIKTAKAEYRGGNATTEEEAAEEDTEEIVIVEDLSDAE